MNTGQSSPIVSHGLFLRSGSSIDQQLTHLVGGEFEVLQIDETEGTAMLAEANHQVFEIRLRCTKYHKISKSAGDLFLEAMRGQVLARLDDETYDYRQLARSAFLSVSQLNKKLNAICGLSANAFIQSIRLEEAAKRLCTSSDSIGQIAFDTGFPTLMRFDQLFKKKYGLAPTQFRCAPK